MRQALDVEDILQWCESMDEEMFGLTRMGVMMHDLTLIDYYNLFKGKEVARMLKRSIMSPLDDNPYHLGTQK